MPAIVDSNEVDRNARFLALSREYVGYKHYQVNGQRVFKKAPGTWFGPEPSRNCEVFIGRIPHDCFEDTLVPLFQLAGELYEFRLMINFSGWNRGYAFAMYTTEAAAAEAIKVFNDYEIRPSWQLGVCQSINNCRIFISRIPPSMTSVDVVRTLYAITQEVHEVRLRRSVVSCNAIVEYKTHKGAAKARKDLMAAATVAWGAGARPTVDWSQAHNVNSWRQYREVGCINEHGEVEMRRLVEGPGAQVSPPSYTLEPRSQARRMRLIQEAEQSATHRRGWEVRHVSESGESSSSGVSCSSGGSPPGSHVGLGLGTGLWQGTQRHTPHLWLCNRNNMDAGPLPMTAGPSQYAGPAQLSGFSQLAISTQLGGPSQVGGAGPPLSSHLPAPVVTADFNPWTSKTFIGDLLHDTHM